MRIEFSVDNLRVDPPIRVGYDVLLRIECDFAVLADDRIVLFEELFPVVEFGRYLKSWSDSDFRMGRPFEFDSMDDDRKGFVWLRPFGGQWGVGSVDTGSAPLGTLDAEEVPGLVRGFCGQIQKSVRERFGYDCSGFISGETSLSAPVSWPRS